jgi:hypothetical protein
MRTRLPIVLLVLAGVALVAGGCSVGSEGKSISSVKSCLKDAKLTVDSAGKNDASVKEGVSGSTDLTDLDKMVLAVAATTKSKKDVDKFQKQTKDLADQIRKEEQAKNKITVESGTDGSYVWVIAGSKKAPAFDDARDCVKP